MNKRIFCIECERYYKDKQDWINAHDTIAYNVKKIKHNYLLEENTLAYILNNMKKNLELEQIINKQSLLIEQMRSKLNYFGDSFDNDVYFETNVCIKNIENKILGKCLLHFFPKSIHFKIEYKGEINFSGKKEFKIEILFPFKKTRSKFSSIEKLSGCISSKTIQNSEGEEITVFNNYSSIIEQKNKIIYIQLLRNYFVVENLLKKKIEICINGILTFSDYSFNLKNNCILYNINQKKFLVYDEYKWKFIENCFTQDGNIKNGCNINLELNFEFQDIYINNQFSFLGNNGNFVTKEKNNAKFKFQFLNQFYGIIIITYGNQYLSSDEKTDLIKLSEEKNYFMILNY